MTSLSRTPGQFESARFNQIAGVPYYPRYKDWLAQREGARGYEFGTPPHNVPPRTMTCDGPPRWYALDRRARLLRERALRDRLLLDVLSLGWQSPSPNGHRSTEARTKAAPLSNDEGLSCLTPSAREGPVSESSPAVMPGCAEALL